MDKQSSQWYFLKDNKWVQFQKTESEIIEKAWLTCPIGSAKLYPNIFVDNKENDKIICNSDGINIGKESPYHDLYYPIQVKRDPYEEDFVILKPDNRKLVFPKFLLSKLTVDNLIEMITCTY